MTVSMSGSSSRLRPGKPWASVPKPHLAAGVHGFDVPVGLGERDAARGGELAGGSYGAALNVHEDDVPDVQSAEALNSAARQRIGRQAWPDDRPLNSGWIEVAPSRDSAAFTTAFDVFGASAVLPRRSVFPVTDAPDRTATTVCGTTPVRCVAFTSFESAVLFRTVLFRTVLFRTGLFRTDCPAGA